MDLYSVLGLSTDATPDQIRRAYQRLARRFHPDINPGDDLAAGRYRLIVEAFETLQDPARRGRYDAGVGAEASPAATVEFEGFDFSQAVIGEQASTFSELFADVLRAPARAAAALRGADLHVELAVDFDLALHGGQQTVIVTRHAACRRCAGRGDVEVADRPCPACRGAGSVRGRRGHMLFRQTCGVCDGTGRLVRAACPECRGEGVAIESSRVIVRVPRGVADGTWLRVPGGGNAGRRAAPAGDLLVTVRVRPHSLFRREGDDLHVEVPVAIHEAALGAKVFVPTPEGRARMGVPPGTQSGQRFRLRNRGAPRAGGAGRGDLIVQVRLVLPRELGERARDLLREFGEIHRENVRAELGV